MTPIPPADVDRRSHDVDLQHDPYRRRGRVYGHDGLRRGVSERPWKWDNRDKWRLMEGQVYSDGCCFVCGKEFRSMSCVIQNPKCYHNFHERCFISYLSARPNCPRCDIDVYQSLKTELNEEISRKA